MQPTGYEWAEDVARILERTTDYQSTEKESVMAMTFFHKSKCVFAIDDMPNLKIIYQF